MNDNCCVLVNVGAATARVCCEGDDGERDFHESVLDGADGMTRQEAEARCQEWLTWVDKNFPVKD